MISRAYGSLIGSAIGDAMGMPASFMTPSQIKENYGEITTFLKPGDEQVAHHHLEAGEITDDTEEAMIISSVLVENQGFDQQDFIKKMKEWAIENKMLESTVIGPSTRRFLESIVKDQYGEEVGKKGDTNGGAMRVAPIGIFYHGDVDETVKQAIQSAIPSHGSKPGIASTCAIAAAISLAVEGTYSVEEIMNTAIEAARIGEKKGFDIPAPSISRRIQLAKEIVDQNKDKSLEDIAILLYEYIGAGMKSYESIPLSLGVFYAAKGEFIEALITVINIGDDADTNGAIVGALCGAYSGAESIPKEWKEYIEKQNPFSFYELAEKLI